MSTLNRLTFLFAVSMLTCPLAGPGAFAERAASSRAKVAVAAPAPAAPPSAYNGHPHLVIILVIDQFRGDYLDRYRADFKGRGFRLFLDKGAYFPDCYYEYANTKTAPGHATLGTGAYTDGHGIGSNEWWDLDRNKERPITSVEDDRYRLVGEPESSIPANGPGAPATAPKYLAGASPRNLLASTVGDELRLATQGKSKVFGISLKDRSAILPAGATANAAFWIDQASGRFVTSSFYLAQLPEWATSFNTSGRIQQAEDEANASDTPKFYDAVGRTPAANDYELDFAEKLIEGEQLGTHDTTDLITVSLSANDIMGHKMGPDSADEQQMVDALDTSLDSFFTWIDKNIDGGLGSVVVALSADHGVAPVPADAAKLGLNAAPIDLTKLVANLDEAMNQKFSPGEKVEYLFPHQELPYFSLNRPNFERAGINEVEAEQAVQNALEPAFRSLIQSHSEDEAAPGKKQPSDTRLPPQPVLYRSFTRLQLASNQLPATEFGGILAHSYTPNGGWYVMVISSAFQIEVMSSSQTSHFSPWSYDRHVPLAFFGAPFNPGVYHGRVAPVDLAATLASVLGLNQPSASVGHILTEALKPASAVVYPKPTPVHVQPAARHRSTAAHSSPESKRSQ